MRRVTILFLLLSTPLWCAAAEVYQSKDANGNTVFSDVPSEGARVIKVTPTNSADPVQDIPALAAPDNSDEEVQPATKLTTSPASAAEDDDDDDSSYWVTDDADRDDINNIRRDREPGRDTPITERPRVQPLPAATRPAVGGAGRR